jgi:hypothetical protein
VRAAALHTPLEWATPETRGWLAAVKGLVPVPADHRSPTVDRRGALEILRCSSGILDLLVEHGLPSSGAGSEQAFDWNDLFNLALYSGSGRSQPERTFRFALRWMSEPSSSWLSARAWELDMTLRCGRDPCGEHPVWRIAKPAPELHGGRVIEWDLCPGSAYEHDGVLELSGATAPRLRATVQTLGERMELVSPELRHLVHTFMDRNLRWVRMPEAVQRCPTRLHAAGIANCVSASIELEQQIAAAGYEVRTRMGWIMGVLDIEHAWIEVRDDDGTVKAVDPVLALLGRMAPNAPRDFCEACLGSRLSRLLPTELRAGESLIQHECGGSKAPVDRRISIRARRESHEGEHGC